MSAGIIQDLTLNGSLFTAIAGQEIQALLDNRPGEVTLRGRADLTTGTFDAATDQLFTTLPAGLRPPRETLVPCALIDTDGTTYEPGVLLIGTDGTINVQGAGGATNKTVSIDGVRFLVGY